MPVFSSLWRVSRSFSSAGGKKMSPPDSIFMCGQPLRVNVLLDAFCRGIGSGHVSALNCSRDGPLASMKFAVREPNQTGVLEALPGPPHPGSVQSRKKSRSISLLDKSAGPAEQAFPYRFDEKV